MLIHFRDHHFLCTRGTFAAHLRHIRSASAPTGSGGWFLSVHLDRFHADIPVRRQKTELSAAADPAFIFRVLSIPRGYPSSTAEDGTLCCRRPRIHIQGPPRLRLPPKAPIPHRSSRRPPAPAEHGTPAQHPRLPCRCSRSGNTSLHTPEESLYNDRSPSAARSAAARRLSVAASSCIKHLWILSTHFAPHPGI